MLEKKEKEKEASKAKPYEFNPLKEPDWMKNLNKKKNRTKN